MKVEVNEIQAVQAVTDLPATDADLPAVLCGDSLNTLGLKPDDLPAIRAIADRLSIADPMSVAEFGRDVADHTSAYADTLLDEVRNSDLDAAGAKLTQVVNAAVSLNLNALSDRRSKIPVIGRWLDKVKLSASNIMGQFDTTREQIEKLLGEVEYSQQGLSTRNSALEEMFAAVKEEHHALGLHIAAGKVRLVELQEQGARMRSEPMTPTRVQEIADVEAFIANLDKRIGDLQALQHSALQSLPMIRMIQQNNRMLVDKFHTVREISIPSWKRQFMLALSLNEQRNAVSLANTIDDATNELLRRNADLLRDNSVATAKANQRLVIDVDTLKHVNGTLIQTVQDVIKIQQEGIERRREAEKQIAAMREDMKAKLVRISSPEAR